MSQLRIAVVQCALSQENVEENVERVLTLVRKAADEGANVVLTPELFEGSYFPQQEDDAFFSHAKEFEDHPTLSVCAEVAKGT